MIGFSLFLVSFVINSAARLLVWGFDHQRRATRKAGAS
jgi:hypothetical protein